MTTHTHADSRELKFLSIQSFVSYGHVGNSAVVFPLQRLGVDVWPVHTVLFSNHTGYESWRGQILDVQVLRDILAGLADRKVLTKCKALLSGYMGSVSLGQVILEAWQAIGPEVFYCCDPVMGDEGRGFFVPMTIADFFKHTLIGYASMITPNHFEFEFLTNRQVTKPQDVYEGSRHLFTVNPRLQVIVVTSLRLENAGADNLCVVAIPRRGQAYYIKTPRLDIHLNGTGDLTSALCSYFYLKGQKNLSTMLSEAICRVFSIIYDTYQNQCRELSLVASQDQLIHPTFDNQFPVLPMPFDHLNDF